MFINAGSNGKDIHVKNYIGRLHSNLIYEQVVCPLADLYLPFVCRCLSDLVKCHYYNSSPIRFYDTGFFHKGFRTLFQTDGIDYAFTLGILQTGYDRFPMGRVNHKRCLCNSRIIRYVPEKPFHFTRAVEHCIVHVDVYDPCTILNLLCGDLQCSFIVSRCNELCEFA